MKGSEDANAGLNKRMSSQSFLIRNYQALFK